MIQSAPRQFCYWKIVWCKKKNDLLLPPHITHSFGLRLVTKAPTAVQAMRLS